MRVLLDTQSWLWMLMHPERLNARATDLIESRRELLFLSAISSLEIAIKCSLGKLELPEPPERYVPGRLAGTDVAAVPVQHAHALRVHSLPAHHFDPFDRVLVAQAQLEKMALLTADAEILRYDVETIWSGASTPPRVRPKRRRDRRR